MRVGEGLCLASAGPAPQDRHRVAGIESRFDRMTLLASEVGAFAGRQEAEAAIMRADPGVEQPDQIAFVIERLLRGDLAVGAEQAVVCRERGLDCGEGVSAVGLAEDLGG
jgi:hypothetical protein